MQRRAIRRRNSGPSSIVVLVASSPRASRAAPRSVQLPPNAWQAPCGEGVGHAFLDPVDGGDQEMARSHGDVRHPEVEERVRCIRLVHRPEAREMVVQRGFQRAVEQVLHGERLGVVAARGLPCPGTVVEIRLPGRDRDAVPGASRTVDALLVESQICLGDAELRLEQPLVDGAELAHARGAEIDGAGNTLRGVDDQEVPQRRLEGLVRQRDGRDRRSARRHVRIAGEQPAVVARNTPFGIACGDRLAQKLEFTPMRVSCRDRLLLLDARRLLLRLLLQRPAAYASLCRYGSRSRSSAYAMNRSRNRTMSAIS